MTTKRLCVLCCTIILSESQNQQLDFFTHVIQASVSFSELVFHPSDLKLDWDQEYKLHSNNIFISVLYGIFHEYPKW